MCVWCCVQNLFYRIPKNESIDLSHYTMDLTSNTSLWDLGNKLITAADDVIRNG